MKLDLTDEEAEVLLSDLNRIIDNDRYFLSPRILTLTAIRDKIRPAPVSPAKPFPAAQHGDGPRAAVLAQKRRRRG